MKQLFDRDYRKIILDLRDLSLADRDAVKFLMGCERDGMKFENCPAHVVVDHPRVMAGRLDSEQGRSIRFRGIS